MHIYYSKIPPHFDFINVSKKCSLCKPQILENGSQDVMFNVYHKVKRGEPVKKRKQEKMTLAKLAEKMDAGFKQVNSRIDRIEQRLDFNDLKKLPIDSNKKY